MAKIRVGGLGRLLLIVVAVVLALPTFLDGAYGEGAGTAPARNPVRNNAAGAGALGIAPTASDASEHPDAATDRCQPRRSGRSTATVAAPAPPGTPVSTVEPVRPEGGRGVTTPLTGRQAVPLSRSGELPVQHGVFRC